MAREDIVRECQGWTYIAWLHQLVSWPTGIPPTNITPTGPPSISHDDATKTLTFLLWISYLTLCKWTLPYKLLTCNLEINGAHSLLLQVWNAAATRTHTCSPRTFCLLKCQYMYTLKYYVLMVSSLYWKVHLHRPHIQHVFGNSGYHFREGGWGRHLPPWRSVASLKISIN